MNGGVEQVVGYKEWTTVCEALGSGRQCLLLRKGGIHEGRAGFSFKHDRFFMFPTRFHAQAEQVQIPCAAEAGAGEWQAGEPVPIQYQCEAIWATTLRDWAAVRQLEPFHVWQENLVRERFDCGEVQQIHCALVRVRALPSPVTIPYEKKYGGCRTWVDVTGLPGCITGDLTPVLGEREFAEMREQIEAILQIRGEDTGSEAACDDR